MKKEPDLFDGLDRPSKLKNSNLIWALTLRYNTLKTNNYKLTNLIENINYFERRNSKVENLWSSIPGQNFARFVNNYHGGDPLNTEGRAKWSEKSTEV